MRLVVALRSHSCSLSDGESRADLCTNLVGIVEHVVDDFDANICQINIVQDALVEFNS